MHMNCVWIKLLVEIHVASSSGRRVPTHRLNVCVFVCLFICLFVVVSSGGRATAAGRSSCGFLPTTWRRSARWRQSPIERWGSNRRVHKHFFFFLKGEIKWEAPPPRLSIIRWGADLPSWPAPSSLAGDDGEQPAGRPAERKRGRVFLSDRWETPPPLLHFLFHSAHDLSALLFFIIIIVVHYRPLPLFMVALWLDFICILSASSSWSILAH